MRLDEEYYRNPLLPSLVVRRSLEPKSYWSSTGYGFVRVLEPDGWIPKGMFQHFNLLSVPKLSACIFNIRSPPFLCCDGLRFLQLDHCQGVDRGIDEEVGEDMLRRFLQRLWVLDVRYSNSAFLSGEMMGFMTQLRELNVMGEEDELFDLRILQGRLDNVRKLRVTKSCVMSVPYIFSGRDKLELLELSGNYCSALFSVEISSCSSLETVVIRGSEDLEEISLMGCAKLKNIFLNGSFMYLRIIEIIGVAVETLDLSAVTARDLHRLLVRACGNLRSILWPPAAEGRSERYLRTVHIDTSTQREGSVTAAAGKEFAWHISVRDARTLGSLEPVKDYFGHKDAHVEISSRLCGDATGSKDNGIMSSIDDNAIYAPALKGAYGGVHSHAPSPTPCPPPPYVPSKGCLMLIEDPIRRTKSQTASITLPGFICDAAKILHVHDSLHITSILEASAVWNQLEWCRVERCPNVEWVFNLRIGADGFRKLRTTWASHLLNARYIWKQSGSSPPRQSLLEGMTLLHLYCCPRLISIINTREFPRRLDSLETLEIMWCGDLRVAFGTIDIFPKLKHIRLHELPKLRGGIMGTGNAQETAVWVPELETIRVRGCWSFRRLLFCDSKKVVLCDCEKEWWGRLEWNSKEWWDVRGVNPIQYKTTHPRYYKEKNMLRGSFLR